MIKVLYVLNGPMFKGGTEAVVLNYFNNINKMKFHIDFLIHGNEEECKNNPIHLYLKKNGAQIYYVTPRGKSYINNLKELKHFFLTHKYDIVHSHMDAAGYFVLKVAKKAGVNVCISHSHNTGGKIINGGKIRSLFYFFILEYARNMIPKYTDKRLACSTEAGNWLFKKADFTVIRNAIDLDKYKFNLCTRENVRKELKLRSEILIGHVGRFTEQKNHTYLINVFAECIKINSDCKLVLVGDGKLKNNVQNQVVNLGLEDKVIFLGVRDDVNRLMQAMDAFVLPSFHEGLPVVGIEAQTAGLPCFISLNVSPEVKITDGVKLISLDEKPKVWAQTILSNVDRLEKRLYRYEQVKNAGYEIKGIVGQLEEIYVDAIKCSCKDKIK